MQKTYDALALFSGGLDSIVAIKVLQEQGIRVLGLHFVCPFFGKPHKVEYWEKQYGVELEVVDIHEEYTRMLVRGPSQGLGKVLNPCVDCKILMLSVAKEMLPRYGAKFLVSGEVLGQRPMSQRKDALNIITRDAGVRDILVRPLSAKHLEPTVPEKEGLVDRDRLLTIWGRGRKEQLRLAREYDISPIPTPAGGCLLAEKESAKRYWPVLQAFEEPSHQDFELANIGRQLWHEGCWLVIGRNKADNEALQELRKPGDLVFDVLGYPSPLGLARPIPGREWNEQLLASAANRVACYSPKALRSGEPVQVTVESGGKTRSIQVTPDPEKAEIWQEPEWEQVAVEKKAARTSEDNQSSKE